MTTFLSSRAVRAALIGVAVIGFATLARADMKDYEFQLVDQAIKAGPDKTIAVRLVNKATGSCLVAGSGAIHHVSLGVCSTGASRQWYANI